MLPTKLTIAGRRVPLALLAIPLGALALWIVFHHGFANYDTFYSLVWGDELAHLHKPDYGAPIPPTPHPLATLFGLIASPLGAGAQTASVIVAFLSLAAVAYLVYRLGERWFNPWAGLLAAVIVITREPVLSYGVRAYVDLPYIALVLAALLVEDRRPRAGWPVLTLLALAGLLRPEAWLFSGAYLLYLAVSGAIEDRNKTGGTRAVIWAPIEDRDKSSSAWAVAGAVAWAAIRSLFEPGGLLPLTLLAASAPIAWGMYDLILSGDALYSLTGTQDTVETLGRDTGFRDAVLLGPRRLGEITREPVLLAAVGGGLLGLGLMRRRVLLGIAAGALAVLAFIVLASAGLAVITRYMLLAGTIVTIFAAGGVLGWIGLDRDNPWRKRWMIFGAFLAVLMVVWIPSQYDRLSNLQYSIGTQERIQDDLYDVAGPSEGLSTCGGPIIVPNHRLVPLLALWRHIRPSDMISSQETFLKNGQGIGAFASIVPTSKQVDENFTLDPNDPGATASTARPPDSTLEERNASWKVYCIAFENVFLDGPGQ